MMYRSFESTKRAHVETMAPRSRRLLTASTCSWTSTNQILQVECAAAEVLQQWAGGSPGQHDQDDVYTHIAMPASMSLLIAGKLPGPCVCGLEEQGEGMILAKATTHLWTRTEHNCCSERPRCLSVDSNCSIALAVCGSPQRLPMKAQFPH